VQQQRTTLDTIPNFLTKRVRPDQAEFEVQRVPSKPPSVAVLCRRVAVN